MQQVYFEDEHIHNNYSSNSPLNIEIDFIEQLSTLISKVLKQQNEIFFGVQILEVDAIELKKFITKEGEQEFFADSQELRENIKKFFSEKHEENYQNSLEAVVEKLLEKRDNSLYLILHFYANNYADYSKNQDKNFEMTLIPSENEYIFFQQ